MTSRPQITWETSDGETFGYYDLGDAGDVEVVITGRIRQSMWTTGTNERTWSVQDPSGNYIGQGCADGLRRAKCEALTVLADHLDRNGLVPR